MTKHTLTVLVAALMLTLMGCSRPVAPQMDASWISKNADGSWECVSVFPGQPFVYQASDDRLGSLRTIAAHDGCYLVEPETGGEKTWGKGGISCIIVSTNSSTIRVKWIGSDEWQSYTRHQGSHPNAVPAASVSAGR